MTNESLAAASLYLVLDNFEESVLMLRFTTFYLYKLLITY